MGGGTREWCLDHLSSGGDGNRVLRGGYCVCDASGCAFSYRSGRRADGGWNDCGFRLFCRPGSK